MSWRETLLCHLGPGLFAGALLSDWLALLRENGFAVAPRHLLRAGLTTLSALANSALRPFEDRACGRQVRAVQVPPPLFVLGHWRSGTTLLHSLLAQDPRFASPNLYQVNCPHTFLVSEKTATRLARFFLPRTRLGVDNVRLDYGMAYEDEFAACIASLRSPYVSWAFPGRADHYDRYLTFRGVPGAEVRQWQQALLLFFQKLTWKYGRPLVLKSPPHTGRVRLLLEMFPEARFVHIHREPYTVFQSAVRMSEVAWRYYALQRPGPGQAEGRVLRQYREMYEAFFADRALIPPGHYHEVAFEALERDPAGEVRRLYEALGLPAFGEVEPALRRHLASLAGYRKNVFPGLPEALRQRVAREWGRCFAEWGYPV